MRNWFKITMEHNGAQWRHNPLCLSKAFLTLLGQFGGGYQKDLLIYHNQASVTAHLNQLHEQPKRPSSFVSLRNHSCRLLFELRLLVPLLDFPLVLHRPSLTYVIVMIVQGKTVDNPQINFLVCSCLQYCLHQDCSS